MDALVEFFNHSILNVFICFAFGVIFGFATLLFVVKKYIAVKKTSPTPVIKESIQYLSENEIKELTLCGLKYFKKKGYKTEYENGKCLISKKNLTAELVLKPLDHQATKLFFKTELTLSKKKYGNSLKIENNFRANEESFELVSVIRENEIAIATESSGESIKQDELTNTLKPKNLKTLRFYIKKHFPEYDDKKSWNQIKKFFKVKVEAEAKMSKMSSEKPKADSGHPSLD